MDIDLSRLIAAARRLNIRITPTRRADSAVIMVEVDVRALVSATSHSPVSTEANAVRGLLITHLTADGERELTARDALRLTGALNRFADATDRARRIDRGQIPGAMSSGEAMRFLRRMGRL